MARFEVERVVLSEYEALREEVLKRLELQQQLQNFGLLILGAAVPLLIALDNPVEVRYVLVAVVFFSVVMAMLMLVQDRMIRLIIGYVNAELAPRLETATGQKPGSLLGWELYQLSVGTSSLYKRAIWGITLLIRYLLFLGIALLCLVVWYVLGSAQADEVPSSGEYVAVGGVVVLLVLTAGQAIYGGVIGWRPITARRKIASDRPPPTS